jgi:hypothetical protein
VRDERCIRVGRFSSPQNVTQILGSTARFKAQRALFGFSDDCLPSPALDLSFGEWNIARVLSLSVVRLEEREVRLEEREVRLEERKVRLEEKEEKRSEGKRGKRSGADLVN